MPADFEGWQEWDGEEMAFRILWTSSRLPITEQNTFTKGTGDQVSKDAVRRVFVFFPKKLSQVVSKIPSTSKISAI